ncbi:MAG: prepilin-type N-terminal cleavage/methylation domain-containing protein [Steroidobacteraceae bacterium]
MRRCTDKRRARGFSLVEVLVALIIIAVGLLGIAKMQALLLADTGVSRLRTLVALEASSLAASMHANADYWAVAPTTLPGNLTVTINPSAATTVTSAGDNNLAGAISAALGNPNLCELGSGSVPCTAADMAGYQLVQWEQAMANVLNTATTDIVCAPVNNGVTEIAVCTITISWTENTVNANRQENNNAAFQNQVYQLVVDP